jgi:FkbM family methyltransferase
MTPRKFRTTLLRLLVLALGRRVAVRTGRALSRAARLDGRNDLQVNGELEVQRVALAGGGGLVVVLDVGANVGDWSLALAGLGRHVPVGTRVQVYALEPASDTFATLSAAVHAASPGLPIKPRNIALSDRNGSAELNVVAAGAGINSLHVQSDHNPIRTETIECATLDDFCAREGVDSVRLLKIDTEGHEMSVLRGASAMLGRGAIDMIQFEYNHRWIVSRHYLRDAFELLGPLGYRIGKITPQGIEFYERWHFELETWYEANYLACRPGWVDRFPRVRWWND